MTRPFALLVVAAALPACSRAPADPPGRMLSVVQLPADTAAVDTAEVARRCRALAAERNRAPGGMPNVVPDTAAYRMPRLAPGETGDRMPNAALPPRTGAPTVVLSDGRAVTCPAEGAKRP